MSKTFLYLIAAIAVVGVSAGGYYVYTRTVVTSAESPSSPSPPASTREPESPKRNQPNHGEFQKRFEPAPPPPNGGKLK